jgi:hypothetical protein
MIEKKSRYAKTPIVEDVVPGAGERAPLLELRDIPPTGGFFHVVGQAGERLDHLAHRYYRDPLRFWRIADASEHLDPLDIVIPGARVVIPPDR